MMAAIRGVERCGRCPAAVLWVLLPSGKRQPVDPEPDDTGTVAAYRDGRGTWVGRVLKKDERTAAYEKRFITHFATCAPTIAARDAHRAGVASGKVVPLHRRRTTGPRR